MLVLGIRRHQIHATEAARVHKADMPAAIGAEGEVFMRLGRGVMAARVRKYALLALARDYQRTFPPRHHAA